MNSPFSSSCRGRLLLLAGSLLGSGCSSQAFSAEDNAPSFQTVPASATAATDALHPIQLRARVVTPGRGIANGLREQHTAATTGGGQRLHFIAQLGQLPSQEQWEELKRQGIHRAAFLHGRSFIIRVELSPGEREARLDLVQEALGALALLPLEPEDRAPAELLAGRFSKGATVEKTGHVRAVVLFFPDTSAETVTRITRDAHRGAGAPEVLDAHVRVIETDVRGLRALVREDAVHDVTERQLQLPLLHRVREITGAEWVQAIDTSFSPPLYYGLSGAGVRVSTNESHDWSHHDFWTHDEVGNAVEARTADCGGISDHGTHVAGIVMGNGFLSGGQRRGMAPNATGVCYYDGQSDVSNHSYVWSVDAMYDGSEAAADGYMNDPANAYHHLHVQAVGNQGLSNQYGSTKGYYSVLASRKNALTVANIDSTDYRWGFSSQGPTLDGRLKPDISAPGSLFRFPEKQQILFDLDSVTVSSNGSPLITWNLDTPGNSEGWAATSNWYHQSCIGALSWTPSSVGNALRVPLLPNCTPWLGTSSHPSGSPLSFTGGSTQTVTLRYRFESTPIWSQERGRFWWSTSETDANGYRFTDFPIIPDGQWRTVTIPVGQLPDWSGSGIRLLRITPVAFTDRSIISTYPGNRYGGNTGSSMAAPAVTGATAQLLEQIVAWYGVDLTLQGQPSPFWRPAPGNGAPMPSTLKAILVHTAKDLAFRPHLTDSANPDTGSVTVYHKGPDLTTGYGALDVAEAQRLVQSGTIFEEELTTSVSHQYTVSVAGDSTFIPQPLKVTLAWSDPPGSTTTASVAPKLVNDLDLVVIAPNGQRFYPWTVPQPYVPASPAAYPENVEPEPLTAASIRPAVQNQEDHLNNLEQVYVETPMAGTWTVRIQPAGLAAPPQRYSLVLGTPEKPAQHLYGGKVAWVSTNRASTAQIFVKDSVPNGTVKQLTWGSNPSSQPVWAPNGAYLAFITQETLGGVNGGTLVIADMAGNSVARWFRPFNTQYIGNPSFSWDARHIAVSYYDNWGCQGLAVVDFTDPYAFHTATMRTLVPALCDAGHPDPFEPDFSHDGEYVYFNGTDDYPAGPGGIFRIPTGGGPIERVFGDGVSVRRAFALSVSPDGKRIVYNSELWREDPVRNWDEEALTVDLETGVTTQLTFEPGHQYGAYAVGGDGEMVMDSSSTVSGNRDLFLMENGHRVRLDIGDPSNSYNDIYSVWWKRAPRCIATPAGLRAWYSLDGLQGTQFADLTGGSSGTVGNGATSTLGMVNSGLGFDGVDDFASVPNQSQLNVGTGDFAITAWVRLPAGDTGTRVLLDKRQSSPLRGYQLLSNRGCLMLQLADAVGTGYSNYSSNVCIADGKWHHVAVSIRRNSATGIQWYRDGAASTVSSSVARNGSLDSTGPLYIGRAMNGGITWRGQLDELLLFGRVLAASEVQTLFQAGPSGMCR